MILNLCKIRIFEFLSTIYGGTKYKNQLSMLKKLSLLIAVVLFVQITTVLTLLLKKFSVQFVDIGNSIDYFFLLGTLLFSFCCLINIFMVRSQLYDAKDNDFLLSLPIKYSSIAISRMLFSYVINVFIIISIGTAAIIDYAIAGAEVSALLVFRLYIMLISMTFLTLGVSYLFGWIFTNISVNVKYKNLSYLLLTGISVFLFAVAIAYSAYNIITYNEDVELKIMKKIFCVIFFFADGIAGNSFLSFILFISISIGIFTVSELFISKTFLNIYSKNRRGAFKENYVEKYHANSCFVTLVKKELTITVKNIMYIVNAGFGIIFSLILICVIIYDKNLIYHFIHEDRLVSMCLIAAICITNSINYFSAPSISLEGESIWLPKSLPIRANDFLFSKATSHILLCLPTTFILATIINIFYDLSMSYRLFIYIIPIPMIVLFSFIGILSNIKFPNFNYVNISAVVKQSISVVLALILNNFIVACPVVIYFFSYKNINDQIFLSAILCCVILIDIIIYKKIEKKGESWLLHLSSGQKKDSK